MPVGGKVSDVRPDPVLTRLAVELGTGGPYVADRIAPVAIVDADTFKYATFGREEIKNDVRANRTLGKGAAEVEITKTYTAGAVEYRSLKSRIPDEIRNNDPNPGSINRRHTKVLTGKLRLIAEDRVATLVKAASNTQTAPGTKWDAANATIRKDILTAKETFRRQCGFSPNVLLLPPAVSIAVFNDTGILDLLKHTQAKLLEDGMIPRIENMEVVVPGAIKDTSNPGAAASVADIYGSDEAYLLYVDPTAGNDLSAQTAIRQVRSTATTGQPYSAKLYRDPDASANTDIVAVECNQVELTLSQAFMLRILDVLT